LTTDTGQLDTTVPRTRPSTGCLLLWLQLACPGSGSLTSSLTPGCSASPANLGQVQERAGAAAAAITAYEQSIETAHACGDLRTAALASARLGHVLRFDDPAAARAAAEWSQNWYASAGAGDTAQLARCVLVQRRVSSSGVRSSR
jgi:hypothetical protein